jgi:DNA glycosylase AlkZ-like
MVRSLTRDEVLRLRLRSQQLAGPQAAEVAEVVRRMGAMQAQSSRDARLAVRPRGRRIDAAAVTEACNVTRSVVRTWAMRGTLQMLARRDAGWIVDLLRPPPGVATARSPRSRRSCPDADRSPGPSSWPNWPPGEWPWTRRPRPPRT